MAGGAAMSDAMARARLANGGRGETNPPPGKFAAAAQRWSRYRRDCDSCPHGRTQHSVQGCTYTEADGSNACICTRTYMDL